jgi:cytochrome b
MFAAVAVQVSLGLISQDEDGIYAGPLAGLVSSDTSDQARDIHEFWFENVILPLIVLHVAAILFYRFRGKGLTKTMITGHAALDPGSEPMKPGKWWVALICLAVAFGTVRWIIAGAPPF